jgi:hypothetical protein
MRMTEELTTRAAPASDTALMSGLRELVRYLPWLEEAGTRPPHPSAPLDRVSIDPRASSDPGFVEAFIDTAYRVGLVETGFDWPRWMRTEEARGLRDDPGRLARATPKQLSRLLTVLIRQDRFTGGSLLAAFDSGLVTAILRRARELVDDEVTVAGTDDR